MASDRLTLIRIIADTTAMATGNDEVFKHNTIPLRFYVCPKAYLFVVWIKAWLQDLCTKLGWCSVKSQSMPCESSYRDP